MAAAVDAAEGDAVVTFTQTMIVDSRSLSMLESPAWQEILTQLSAIYLNVYPPDHASRPSWLDQREELSHFAFSLSTEAMSPEEIKLVATQIAREHSFNAESKKWAAAEAKWAVTYLSSSSTLLAAFIDAPEKIRSLPGEPAPAGHACAGKAMRVALIHTSFQVLARNRRLTQLVDVLPTTQDDSAESAQSADFIVHDDGSVSSKPKNAIDSRRGEPPVDSTISK